MESISQDGGEQVFPPEKITRQLEKINSDTHFGSSEILRNFLNFIVTETMAGRSNCLKEYTIALKVLNKPITFKPKENCIVRIHAVRLRKALMDYYNGPGVLDEIRITLPKGNYIPVFSNNDFMLNSVLGTNMNSHEYLETKTITAAVIPFHCQERKQLIRNFSDGLGIQLSSALTKVKSLSVISYNISRRMPEKFTDVKNVGQIFRAQYVFTGDVQYQHNTMRVTIQMIKADTSEQIWTQMFERKFSDATSFKVQDDIIEQVIKAMHSEGKILIERKKLSIMAVA